MSSAITPLRVVSWHGALGLWTVGIWGSRLRNAIGDEELVGSAQATAFGIAAVFVVLGVAIGFGALRRQWHWPPLVALAAVGIVRWSYRGPIILFSDEWSIGFKVVHTVLWLVTVALSVLALREYRRVRESPVKDPQTSMVS